MLYPLKLYLKHPASLTLLLSSFFINLAAWVWLWWNIPPQTEPVFLHYTVLFGVDLIGPWWQVLYLPFTGLLIFISNALVGWFLFDKDKFASHLLNFITLFCEIFLLVEASLLVFLNV